MLIDNALLYSPGYRIQIGDPDGGLFYDFDYNERSAEVDMLLPHSRPLYELCILLDESACYVVGDRWYHLCRMDILALPPSLLHKTAYLEDSPTRWLVIRFVPPAPYPEHQQRHIRCIFEEDCPIYRFHPYVRIRILEKLNEIYAFSRSPNERTESAIHQRFTEFLDAVYLWREENIYVNQLENDHITHRISSIIAYIHSHFTEDLSLDSLSSAFSISSCYLSRRFKQITGFTLTDYIQITRVKNAQALLASSDIPITEIAFQSGFSSFSQFSRAFHKFSSHSPSAFRREARRP